MKSIKTIFYLDRASERQGGRQTRTKKEAEGEGTERARASRQMLNGACKYRERRDTKGERKRSGVRGQAGRATGRIGGDVPWSVHRVPRGHEDSASERNTSERYTLQEKEDRKGVGG